MIPFLCLSFPYYYLWLTKQARVQSAIIMTFIFLSAVINVSIYYTSFANKQKIPNIAAIVAMIQKEKPQAIYGTNDIATAFAYLTNTPMLNSIVDTNTNIYRKGFLNAHNLTNDAITQKALIVGHGLSYPAEGIQNDLIDEIFDAKAIKECELLTRIPVTTEDLTNAVVLFSCQ